MNPIREAAIAMEQAKQSHPGLAMKMIVDDRVVCVIGHYKLSEMSQAVTWTEIEAARMNVLTAKVALIVNKLVAKAA